VLGLVARFKEDVLAPLRHIELAKLAQRRVAATLYAIALRNGGVLPPLKTVLERMSL
jgi:hypothetical protein